MLAALISFWEQNKSYLLTIAGVGLAVYFNSLFSPFIWDDIAQIQQNALVHSLTNLPNLFLGSTFAPIAGTSGAGAYYRPLMSLVFATIYSLVGAQTFLFHFVQLLIHIVNTILLFVLFERLFRKKLIAFIFSLIFLVHPMNVESVAYISALGEPLFVLFGLSALLLFQQKGTTKHAVLVGIYLFNTR